MATLKELRKQHPDIKATSVKGFLEKLKVKIELSKMEVIPDNKSKGLKPTHPTNKSKGLGDTIEKITKATGIKKVVEFIAGKDCGCDKRKAYLNKKFRYKVECMVESEYIWWGEYLKRQSITKIEKTDVFEISRIFTRLFKQKAAICFNCKSGAKRILEIIDHINKVYLTYKTN